MHVIHNEVFSEPCSHAHQDCAKHQVVETPYGVILEWNIVELKTPCQLSMNQPAAQKDSPDWRKLQPAYGKLAVIVQSVYACWAEEPFDPRIRQAADQQAFEPESAEQAIDEARTEEREKHHGYERPFFSSDCANYDAQEASKLCECMGADDTYC